MKKRTILPTYERLHFVFSYDPASGILRWKNPTANRVKRGAIAGTKLGKHLIVSLDGKDLLVHRVAWKIMMNEEPPDEIDHKNTTGDDNSWDNLRDANRHNNLANANKYSSNSSGIKGVDFHKGSGLFRARITINYADKTIGYFKTLEEAAQARKDFALKLHGEYAREG